MFNYFLKYLNLPGPPGERGKPGMDGKLGNDGGLGKPGMYWVGQEKTNFEKSIADD